ncbi:MAG: hypothetical protein WCE61_08840 [Candidatus Acidiferrum sp.]
MKLIAWALTLGLAALAQPAPGSAAQKKPISHRAPEKSSRRLFIAGTHKKAA